MRGVWGRDVNEMEDVQATAAGRVRKRKAEVPDGNERLSKRLSLLNLERNGQKLYVPVEQPKPSPPRKGLPTNEDKERMDLDDSKHKVYIYDLDAELSDSESDDGKLVFLPDIEKHLRATRIPPSILANSEGELAGNNQLVLYNIPSSLTVPEEFDSVRKAIIETRARARAKQAEKRISDDRDARTSASPVDESLQLDEWSHGTAHEVMAAANPFGAITKDSVGQGEADYDPDAMDLG